MISFILCLLPTQCQVHNTKLFPAFKNHRGKKIYIYNVKAPEPSALETTLFWYISKHTEHFKKYILKLIFFLASNKNPTHKNKCFNSYYIKVSLEIFTSKATWIYLVYTVCRHIRGLTEMWPSQKGPDFINWRFNVVV